MMASSICSLILDHTSEARLGNFPGFDQATLEKLSRLFAKSLATQHLVHHLYHILTHSKHIFVMYIFRLFLQEMRDDSVDESDLYEIVASGKYELIKFLN